VTRMHSPGDLPRHMVIYHGWDPEGAILELTHESLVTTHLLETAGIFTVPVDDFIDDLDVVQRNHLGVRRSVPPCPCECNSGGFCGGCGHAGCGGRRR
jgi:hypothetical protein